MSKKLLEESVGKELLAQGLTIACAESCTGGLLTSRLTDIAGSSAYVMGSVVSYTNRIKESLVGVRHETLLSHGAVSEETAREMMAGIKAHKLLEGVRGQGPVDFDRLAALLVHVSELPFRYRDLKEMDLNPVFAYEDTAVAVDARMLKG